jgi:hypothetical protein
MRLRLQNRRRENKENSSFIRRDRVPLLHRCLPRQLTYDVTIRDLHPSSTYIHPLWIHYIHPLWFLRAQSNLSELPPIIHLLLQLYVNPPSSR